MGIVLEPRVRGLSTVESHYQAKTGEDSRLKRLSACSSKILSVQNSESAVTICTILMNTKYLNN
jgi:hypothetical protein